MNENPKKWIVLYVKGVRIVSVEKTLENLHVLRAQFVLKLRQIDYTGTLIIDVIRPRK